MHNLKPDKTPKPKILKERSVCLWERSGLGSDGRRERAETLGLH